MSWPSSVGNVPVNEFAERSKVFNADSKPMCVGTVPVKELLASDNRPKPANLPNSNGTVPFNWFKLMESSKS